MRWHDCHKIILHLLQHAKNWVPSGDELDTLQSDSWSAEEVVLRVSAGLVL